MHLRLNQFEKSYVRDVSTLSGYPPTVVREILEFVFLRQIEQYEASTEMHIPFLGKIKIIDKGDIFVSGAKQADIDVLFAPSDVLKKVVGDVADGESSIIENLLQQKVENALETQLQEDEE